MNRSCIFPYIFVWCSCFWFCIQSASSFSSSSACFTHNLQHTTLRSAFYLPTSKIAWRHNRARCCNSSTPKSTLNQACLSHFHFHMRLARQLNCQKALQTWGPFCTLTSTCVWGRSRVHCLNGPTSKTVPNLRCLFKKHFDFQNVFGTSPPNHM